MLTVKQEAFCLAYVETGNASEAYRRAYEAGNMAQAVIANKASELLKKGDVRVMVESLQAKAIARHVITVDDLIAELEEARILAATGEKPQTAAMVSATMGKAKLLGFDVQKVEANLTANQPYEFIVRRAGTELPKV